MPNFWGLQRNENISKTLNAKKDNLNFHEKITVKYTNIMLLMSVRLHQNRLLTVHVTKIYIKALPYKAPGSDSYTDEFYQIFKGMDNVNEI